jgi:plastocyanin
MLRMLRLLPALALLGPLAPVQAGAQAQAGGQVTIVDFDYQAPSLTVDAGTKVTWRNTGLRPHTATDRGGTFDSQPISPGGSASVTFSVPGTYFYFCRINPSKMNGVVVVRPGATPAKVTRVQAIDPGHTGQDSFKFDPSTLSVPAGSTILFANVGGKPHTLTADDGAFDTGVVAPGAEDGRFAGDNVPITLTKPGRFPFHCDIHPKQMKGVLTVTGNEVSGQALASAGPARTRIGLRDFAFEPLQVAVAPGAEVTFANGGPSAHTATFDDVKLTTGILQPNTERKLTAPTKPGSYSYRCEIHPKQMRAVLVVLGPGVVDPTKQQVGPPAGVVTVAGPGGGVSALALAAAVLAALLGGFGLAALAMRRRGKDAEASSQAPAGPSP